RPPLMYHIPDNSTIGRWHYEQEIALDGSVQFRGREHPIKGHGWRVPRAAQDICLICAVT
ncbi:MAG: hypothetical protein ABW110_04465, partial [Steroidobacteraceae bacterium]